MLLGVDRGGFPEAVIRMLILMAESRAAKVLSTDEPFASLGPERRALLIHEQSVIVEFEPDIAIASLPKLLVGPEERQKAVEVVEYIAGAIEEMEPGTIQMVQRFRAALGLPAFVLSAPEVDPLPPTAEAPAAAEWSAADAPAPARRRPARK
jgi:hypothetical protein